MSQPQMNVKYGHFLCHYKINNNNDSVRINQITSSTLRENNEDKISFKVTSKTQDNMKKSVRIIINQPSDFTKLKINHGI